MTGRTQLDYWCYTDLSLESLVARFSTGFIICHVETDAENVWCWAEGTTEDGQLSFNISRKHHAGHEPERTQLPVEPVSIRFIRHQPNLNDSELGQKLANASNWKFFLGPCTIWAATSLRFSPKHLFNPLNTIEHEKIYESQRSRTLLE